jgi:hypothetical protein
MPTQVHPAPPSPAAQALPNVVRDIRQTVGITQNKLAQLSALSEGFILRAEQYLHIDLSHRLSYALSKIDPQGRSPDELNAAYHKGRLVFLSVNAAFLKENPYLRVRIRSALNYAIDYGMNSDQALLDDTGTYSHPFRLFRSHLFTAFGMPVSQIKFCLFTGLHPTVVAAIESYQNTIDPAVEEVLTQVLGMQQAEINTLKILCDQAM